MDHYETRREAATGTHMLSEFGLATGVRASLGHVSVRLPEDPTKFVVKGRGYRLDTLARTRPEDLVVSDLDANLVDGPAEVVPCFEVKIHSCILRDHPEVQSVVHVHPTYTVLLSVLGKPLSPLCAEGSSLVLDPLPVYPRQKIITTDAEGAEVSKLLGNGPAVLLFGHGAVTAGESLEESVTRMIHLEHQAWMNYLAYAVAGKEHPSIPRELVQEARAGVGGHLELPHFRQAQQKAGAMKYRGVWEYWKSLVATS